MFIASIPSFQFSPFSLSLAQSKKKRKHGINFVSNFHGSFFFSFFFIQERYSAGVTDPREWFQFTKWRIYYIHATTVGSSISAWLTWSSCDGWCVSCEFCVCMFVCLWLTCHRWLSWSQDQDSLHLRCHKNIPNPVWLSI